MKNYAAVTSTFSNMWCQSICFDVFWFVTYISMELKLSFGCGICNQVHENLQLCFFFFLKKIYLFLLQSWIYGEEERQRGRSSVQWFSPQVTVVARAEPIQSQEPGILAGFPHGCRVNWPSSSAFPGHKQGAGWEAGRPGLEPEPIWDPGTFKVRNLVVRPQRWASAVVFMGCAKCFISVNKIDQL